MKGILNYLFSPAAIAPSLIALILRVVFGGGMALFHGYGKFQSWHELKNDFATPFGMSDATAAALTIFAEFFCCLFIAAGLFTRLASVPIIICMAVAAFNIHAGDPLADREGALTYLAAFIAIFLTGGGRWSIDHFIARYVSGRQTAH